jgi:hypothetical protein
MLIESYPGQAYFWQHSRDIRNAELNWMYAHGEVVETTDPRGIWHPLAVRDIMDEGAES